MTDINIQIFRLLNNLAGQSKFFDSIVVFIANPFGILLIVGVVIFLLNLFYKKEGEFTVGVAWNHFKEVVVIFSTAICALFFSHLFKYIFKIPRPFLALPNVHSLFIHGGFDSFPSGHATFFSALAVSVYFYHKRLGIFLGISALLIGISRIISGVHYPIEIFIGYVLGGSLALVVPVLWTKFKKFSTI